MSREADLYKDKIEVSLDGRQIFYLFFGGAVIVGLVFVLGVMVGRRVEARGHTDRARNAATVDPLAALDRLEGGNGLSFQGALRAADGPATDVEKTIAALPKKDDKPAKKDEAKVEVKAEPKPEAKKDEPKLDAKKPAAKPPEPKKDEPKKVDAKAEAKKDEPAKPDVAKKPDPKADVAKKDEPKNDKPVDKPAPRFALQLASFQDKAEAQAYLEQVKANGLPAYVTEADVDGKTFFRVRVGKYSSVDAASDAKVDIDKTTKKSASIVKVN